MPLFEEDCESVPDDADAASSMDVDSAELKTSISCMRKGASQGQSHVTPSPRNMPG